MTAKIVTVKSSEHLSNMVDHHEFCYQTAVYAFFQVRPKKYVLIAGPETRRKEFHA
jgi:hypothetical protein